MHIKILIQDLNYYSVMQQIMNGRNLLFLFPLFSKNKIRNKIIQTYNSNIGRKNISEYPRPLVSFHLMKDRTKLFQPKTIIAILLIYKCLHIKIAFINNSAALF